MPNLSSIHIYPLKSSAPIARTEATVELRGLSHDRRWMVVDAQGKMLTGRQLPKLTLVTATPDGNSLALQAPGMPVLRLDPPAPNAARLNTLIWDDPVAPLFADVAAHSWISTFLGQQCRIVYMDSECVRVTDPNYATPGDEVSLADGFPLLLISQAAVDHLNTKLKQHVSILRFRPNLVVSGTRPHAEDGWKRIRIGETEFDLVKPCVRCVFTTVDFERGELDPSGEPLRTMLTYRRTPKGVTFGQNLIPRRLGTLRVGDEIQVLA
jgi:MOSC domain-containing protein